MADVPKIRFKGFSDDWEQRKLGEILVSLQNNTLSRAELSKEKGITRLITLHQRKCDELKEVKKFMLQNMFPKKG